MSKIMLRQSVEKTRKLKKKKLELDCAIPNEEKTKSHITKFTPRFLLWKKKNKS